MGPKKAIENKVNENSSRECQYLGNTKPSIDTPKQLNQAKNWTFTFNNWTSDEYEILLRSIRDNSAKCIIAKEIAPTTGTPHLQGYCSLLRKARPSEIIPFWKKCHWEKAKGNVEAQWLYHTKLDTVEPPFHKGFEEMENKYEIIETIKSEDLYPWEEEIILRYNEHLEKRDCRTIYWIIDTKGGKGKTTFCKYLIVNLNFGYFSSGKANDICQYFNTNRKKAYCMNFSRASESTIQYQAIEAIKDGLVFSGKYESTHIIMNSPFIIGFSNWMPEYIKLTKDRWMIMNLDFNDITFRPLLNTEYDIWSDNCSILQA